MVQNNDCVKIPIIIIGSEWKLEFKPIGLKLYSYKSNIQYWTTSCEGQGIIRIKSSKYSTVFSSIPEIFSRMESPDYYW